MAGSSGPDIITDQLVLCLDAGDTNSYAGSGVVWSDLSGQGVNGTLENGVGYSANNLGSLVFDEVDDSVNFGNILQLGTSSRTYCCWYRNAITSSASIRTLLSKTDNNATAYRQALGFNSDGSFRVILRAASNANYDMDTTNPKNDTNWHYLTWVIDRSSTQRLYQDGILLNSLDISAISSQDFQKTRPFRVGSYNSSSDLPTLPFNGNISHIAIYNKALSLTEIKQNFDAMRSRFGV